jgi:Spy/CpxP family protein refolding chaperone
MGIGVVAALAVLMVVSLATGQPGAGGGGGFGGGNFDPEQMRQMMDQRYQENLGATAEEWKVVGPKFNAVQTLNRSINGGGMGIGMGMGRGGTGGRGGMMNLFGEPTALDKARDSLYTVLDNTSATPEQIQAALKTFRDARDKAKKDMATAQADLKKVVTPKQEARLVGMGLLD